MDQAGIRVARQHELPGAPEDDFPAVTSAAIESLRRRGDGPQRSVSVHAGFWYVQAAAGRRPDLRSRDSEEGASRDAESEDGSITAKDRRKRRRRVMH